MDERKTKNPSIMCPWITCQPMETPSSTNNGPPCGDLKQSSSCFFYFVRLMQLFPDTHPATLHTVLTLCNNNFFCAVDKLLYAKHCKKMAQKPYQKENVFVGKTIILQKSTMDENKSNKSTINSGGTLVENEKEKHVETVPSSCNNNKTITVDGQTSMAKLEEFLL